MSSYNICEKFISINGEGRFAGSPSVFIRFKGCNLNCSYCDTKWANRSDAPCEIMSEDEIYSYIRKSGIERVTLTGGEPLIQPDIGVLIRKLCSDKGLKVEIETNGSRDISEFMNMENRPSFTLDYKTPSSGMESGMLISNYDFIDERDTLKFVCGSVDDLEKAKYITDRYKPKAKIYISPVFGSIEPRILAEFIIDNKMNNVSLQIQLHKVIWESDKRGV